MSNPLWNIQTNLTLIFVTSLCSCHKPSQKKTMISCCGRKEIDADKEAFSHFVLERFLAANTLRVDIESNLPMDLTAETNLKFYWCSLLCQSFPKQNYEKPKLLAKLQTPGTCQVEVSGPLQLPWVLIIPLATLRTHILKRVP